MFILYRARAIPCIPLILGTLEGKITWDQAR